MIHLPDLIVDLALILGAAAFITLIFKKLKQPLVLGYIIAGFLVGPNFTLFPTVLDPASIKTWAEIGVIFLLFSLGLEFSFKKLVKVGTAASITAVFEVAIMVVLGFLTGKLLGWSKTDSIFLGGILSISSTTIIIRAFEELGIKNQKFAGLVFGILIVEDLVAILLLVLLSTLALSQQFTGVDMMISLAKLGFFLALWFLAGIFLIPTFLKRIKKLMSDETLLVVALALCMSMVILAVQTGFSPALGAFIMGSILAETTYAEKIEHLTKPVKDLFGAIFFVSVGMLIDPSLIKEFAWPIVIISFVTIFGKFFSTTLGALLAGQPLKQSIKAGMSLSQIGEFSFIIATLGLTLNVTSEFLYPISVAVSAVTTFITPYFIRFADPLYNFIEKKLPESTILSINRYSSSMQTIKNTSEWKSLLKHYGIIISVNCIVVTGIIYLSTNYLAPFITEKINSIRTGKIITAFITILFMTPFLWALVMKKVKGLGTRRLWISFRNNRAPLVTLEILRVLLAIFLVSFLLNQLFSLVVAFVAALIIVVTIGAISSKRLQAFYNIIEERFITNLNARELRKAKTMSSDLLPWDAHIAEFAILPESPFAGKTLKELGLREKFGINVTRIQRGKVFINIPKRDDVLFPADNIRVIGSDEQLDAFRRSMEITSIDQEDSTVSDVTLQRFVVEAKSPFIGRPIRELFSWTETKGLVVGIEREGKRILNPESFTILLKDDLLWIVGESGTTQILKDKKT